MCMLQNSNYHNHSFNPEKKASTPQTNPHFLSVIFGFLSLSLSLKVKKGKKKKKKLSCKFPADWGLRAREIPLALDLSLSFFPDNPTKD